MALRTIRGFYLTAAQALEFAEHLQAVARATLGQPGERGDPLIVEHDCGCRMSTWAMGEGDNLIYPSRVGVHPDCTRHAHLLQPEELGL